jgi:hypothetical protein
MDFIFAGRSQKYGYVDYVGAWLLKAADLIRVAPARASLVATNSVNQGRQVAQLWPLILDGGVEISFAYSSFRWRNNASNNAVVTCVIVGLGRAGDIKEKYIYGEDSARSVRHINAYLLDRGDVYVESRPDHIGGVLSRMVTGSVPNDGGFLLLEREEVRELETELPGAELLISEYYGALDFITGNARYCLYISDEKLPMALTSRTIRYRLDEVRLLRARSKKREAREILSKTPHRFQHDAGKPRTSLIIVPRVTTENRDYLPVGILSARAIISDQAFGLFDAALWNLAVLSSRIHLVWIANICGRLKTDFRYSNSLGWNSFPIGNLTDKNKADLTRTAEDILLAREAHFPATIADLYDPEEMPADLRAAHERNDEVLERIYIGRRFRNDTERLEKLFELYTKMTAAKDAGKKRK